MSKQVGTVEQRARGAGIDQLADEVHSLGAKIDSDRLAWRLFAVVLVVVLVAAGVLFFQNRHTARSTNEKVTQEIPGLKKQIADRDATIAEQKQQLADTNDVLTKQAVPAILKLANQVKSLGGDPGQVVLKPPEHPTTTTTAPH